MTDKSILSDELYDALEDRVGEMDGVSFAALWSNEVFVGLPSGYSEEAQHVRLREFLEALVPVIRDDAAKRLETEAKAYENQFGSTSKTAGVLIRAAEIVRN